VTPTLTPTPTCASGVLVENARFLVKGNLTPAGDEKLVLRGDIHLTVLSPSIDPIAHGFEFTVFDAAGNPLYKRAIPAGPGWSFGGSHFKFSDRTGTLAGGIQKILLSDRSLESPGLFRVKILGRDADFQVPLGSQPVQLEVVFGGAAQRTAGQCATRIFNSFSGPAPNCRVSATGNQLKCK
jgi:hypothetical protein